MRTTVPQGIPVAWPLERGKIPPLHRIREIWRVLSPLAALRGGSARASELMSKLGLSADSPPASPWTALVQEILQAWAEETADEPTPVNALMEYSYELLAQRRRDEQFGRGVILNTVHAAKGTEHAHVLLCGDWSTVKPAEIEEQRRVLYVGMTRARHTLAIFNRMDRRNPLAADLVGPVSPPGASPPAPRRRNPTRGTTISWGLMTCSSTSPASVKPGTPSTRRLPPCNRATTSRSGQTEFAR